MDTWILAGATFFGIVAASIINIFVIKCSNKRERLKERFNMFYSPYVKMIFGNITEADFSSYIPEKEEKIAAMLEAGIEFAPAVLQKQIFEFLYQFRKRNNATDGSLDGCWSKINKKLFCDYEELCCKLNYAPLSTVHQPSRKNS